MSLRLWIVLSVFGLTAQALEIITIAHSDRRQLVAGATDYIIAFNNSGKAGSNYSSIGEVFNAYTSASTLCDNIVFLISADTFPLNVNMKFERCKNISFRGQGMSLSKIVCSSGAGLSFENSSQVTLEGVQFAGCGLSVPSTSSVDGSHMYAHLTTGLLFSGCSDVDLRGVFLNRSVGTGVAMYDVSGVNGIDHCHFHGRSGTPRTGLAANGAGLYIEMTYNASKQVDSSVYRVMSSHFIDNKSFLKGRNATYVLPNKNRHVSFGRGGGMGIFLRGSTFNNTFTVEACHFEGNSAVWGAGLYASFQDDAFGNRFQVTGSHFAKNEADSISGHGFDEVDNKGNSIHASFLTFQSAASQGNEFRADGCTFMEKRLSVSVFEVGLNSLSSVFSNFFLTNSTVHARIDRGSAVSFTSLSGKVSHLKVTVENLSVDTDTNFNANGYIPASSASGFRTLLYVQNVMVSFAGEVILDSLRKGQAVVAVDSRLVLEKGSSVTVRNNMGISGGGVALKNSFIQLSSDVKLLFHSNTALKVGGAIHSTFTPTRSPYIRLCFLHYHDIAQKPEEWDNVVIQFINNTAAWKGNAVYATLLRNCFWGRAYGPQQPLNVRSVFNCPRVFQYEPPLNLSQDISTGAAFIHSSSESSTISFIPGKVKDLSNCITAIDDFNQSAKFSSFSLQLYNEGKSAIKEVNHFTDTFQLSLFGQPSNLTGRAKGGQDPMLAIQSLEDYTVMYVFPIEMSCCPAGFTFDPTSSACVCINLKNSIMGECDPKTFDTHLLSDYWMGYRTSNNNTACDNQLLWAGECPGGLCARSSYLKTLPPSNSKEELNQVMCGENNREGILCSKCASGHCNPINVCSDPCVRIDDAEGMGGWWKWLLTETLPVTVFSIVILLLDINVLFGPLNSYLLYAQFIALLYASQNEEPFEKSFLSGSAAQENVFDNVSISNYLLRVYGVFTVSVFNLEFFSTLLPSFCLNSDQYLNIIHLIGIKFLFKLWPLLLVVAVIATFWIRKKCSNSICCATRDCRCCEGRMYTRIIGKLSWRATYHALAAIFVLNYAGFLKWAAAILTPVFVTEMTTAQSELHVYYHGEWLYSDFDFLIISIPVVFFITVINLPLTIFLMCCYPLIPNLLERDSVRQSKIMCIRNLHRRKFVRFLKKDWIRHTANLFQAPYKDGLRKGFSGFLLLFRIPLVIAIMVPSDYKYLGCCVLFIVLMIVHYFCQPNKRQLVNHLDMLMYSHMLLLSLLCMYRDTSIYFVNDDDGDERGSREIFPYNVCLLLVELLPTLYLIFGVSFVLARKFRRCRCCNNVCKRLRAVCCVAADDAAILVRPAPPFREDGYWTERRSYGST